jgi:Zn-dependent M28 family amino/carboxypeptidase
MLAHLDSMYEAPGANDNGATLVVMLMWAHALSGRKPRKTLTFIAPDVEECGMIGAYKYVEKRKAAGTFENIKYVFNYDSFTWGPDIVIYGRDKELISSYSAIKDELKVGGEFQVTDHDGFWLDAEPFKSDKIRAISVSTGGLNVATGGSSVFDKCWHQPADLPENVNVEWTENHYNIFMKYLEKIQSM